LSKLQIAAKRPRASRAGVSAHPDDTSNQARRKVTTVVRGGVVVSSADLYATVGVKVEVFRPRRRPER
jgi:hypothetical protein